MKLFSTCVYYETNQIVFTQIEKKLNIFKIVIQITQHVSEIL